MTATALNDSDEFLRQLGEDVDSSDLPQVDFDLSISVPAGYQVVEGNAQASSSKVAAGEKATTQVVLAKSSQSAFLPLASEVSKTGDFLPVIAGVVALVAVVALLLLLFARRRGKKDASKRIFCSLLSLALVVGLSPFVATGASGETSDKDGSAEQHGDEHNAQSSVTIQVGDEDVAIDASMQCDFCVEASDVPLITHTPPRASALRTQENIK